MEKHQLYTWRLELHLQHTQLLIESTAAKKNCNIFQVMVVMCCVSILRGFTSRWSRGSLVKCWCFLHAWRSWCWVFELFLFFTFFPTSLCLFFPHRYDDEWKVGPELHVPRRISDTQPVHVVFSHVHAELQLQRRKQLLHHRNHHLHVWTRWEGHQLTLEKRLPVVFFLIISLTADDVTGTTRMIGGGVQTTDVIMRKRSENRGYTDENIRDSIVMGDLSAKFADLGMFSCLY